MQLLPLYVDSLIICCPPPLRLLPWHLLLVEVPAEDDELGGIRPTAVRDENSLASMGLSYDRWVNWPTPTPTLHYSKPYTKMTKSLTVTQAITTLTIP